MQPGKSKSNQIQSWHVGQVGLSWAYCHAVSCSRTYTDTQFPRLACSHCTESKRADLCSGQNSSVFFSSTCRLVLQTPSLFQTCFLAKLTLAEGHFGLVILPWLHCLCLFCAQVVHGALCPFERPTELSAEESKQRSAPIIGETSTETRKI